MNNDNLENITEEKQKSLEFHIQVDDYFVTLATNLNLLKQEIEENGNKKLCIDCLKSLISDLMYLQKKYKIELK